MPKACIGPANGPGGALVTESSAGLPAIFGAVVPVAVVMIPHLNPDGTAVKDTRK